MHLLLVVYHSIFELEVYASLVEPVLELLLDFFITHFLYSLYFAKRGRFVFDGVLLVRLKLGVIMPHSVLNLLNPVSQKITQVVPTVWAVIIVTIIERCVLALNVLVLRHIPMLVSCYL